MKLRETKNDYVNGLISICTKQWKQELMPDLFHYLDFVFSSNQYSWSQNVLTSEELPNEESMESQRPAQPS